MFYSCSLYDACLFQLTFIFYLFHQVVISRLILLLYMIFKRARRKLSWPSYPIPLHADLKTDSGILTISRTLL
jgi:hypothetical protein